MKNLGKQMVNFTQIADGVPEFAFVDTRIVYEDSSGRYWVNYLDGKREVTKNEDGTFRWDFHIKSLKITSGADLIKMLTGG